MDFDTDCLAFLRRGPAWTPAEPPDLDRLQAAHLACLARLTASGQLVLNGPCVDGDNLRGVSVYKVASLAEAQATCATCPRLPMVIPGSSTGTGVRPPAPRGPAPPALPNCGRVNALGGVLRGGWRGVAAADPMLQTGRLVIEFHSWLVTAGSRLP